jgi:hypothetical protein
MERGVSSSGAAPNGSFDRMESSYCHHDYRLDYYERYFLGGKFQNSKLFCHFFYTERLPQIIYVRLL